MQRKQRCGQPGPGTGDQMGCSGTQPAACPPWRRGNDSSTASRLSLCPLARYLGSKHNAKISCHRQVSWLQSHPITPLSGVPRSS